MLRINLLQGYQRRRRPAFSWRAAGFGFLLGVLVAAAAGMFFFRPGWLGGLGVLGGLGGAGSGRRPAVPAVPAVTVSPDSKARRRADAAIRAESSGRLTGEVQLRRPPGRAEASAAPGGGVDRPGLGPGSEVAAIAAATPQGPGGPEPAPTSTGNHTTPEEIVPPVASLGAEVLPAGKHNNPSAESERSSCPGGLHPGDRVEVPVTGVIHAVYTDSRTDREIGTGGHPVTGVATVAVTEDLRLRVDAEFTDSVEIAIDVPEQHWFVGTFAAASFGGLEAGLFVDYRTTLAEFPRLGVSLVAGGLAEVYRGAGGLGARVEVRMGVVF